MPNLITIGQNVADRPPIWPLFYFPRWRPSAILDLLCVCSDHPRRSFCGLITVQNFLGINALVLIICMFVDITSLAWKRLFSARKLGFSGTFPPNYVTHHPDPKKDYPWAEPRHLSHKACTSAARFELGIGSRKRTVQKKVTNGLYFTS